MGPYRGVWTRSKLPRERQYRNTEALRHPTAELKGTAKANRR